MLRATIKPLTPRVIGKFLEHCMRDGKNGCWTWDGPIHKATGYGTFEVLEIEYKAHRVSYFYFNGKKMESKYDILHTCDNRICVNPAHLYEGTNLENMGDRACRNPESFIKNGSTNPAAKITEKDIPDIFWKYYKKRMTQLEISNDYDVTPGTISKILLRNKWRHVPINIRDYL
jgi:HNH endonuclease